MAVSISGWIGGYQLQNVIGRGASSIVYRALDGEQHSVAVKVIREELLVDAERSQTLERVAREARIGKLLQHRHIIRMFDWGEHEGMPYLVMDLLNGEGLDELIARSPSLAPGTVCTILVEVLDGLAHAHSHNIIHRDIKPANIVLRGRQSDPVLTDFGIAHISASALTQLGDLLGTPAYLSPEQLRGEPADQRSDIFAVGVTLYEALAGQRPFDGSVAEVMRRILLDDPPPLSQVRPELAPLDDIVARALAKDPRRRFETANALAAALGQASIHFDTETAPAVVAARTKAPPTRGGDASLAQLGRAFDAIEEQGITPDLANLVRGIIARLPAVEAQRAGALCGGRGLLVVAEQLYATVPLPKREPQPSAKLDDWVDSADLAKILFTFAQRHAPSAAAETAMATLTHAVACEIVAVASDIGGRLTADEAPDLEVLAPALTCADRIAVCLDAFEGGREGRLVGALLQLVIGQIIRRAASFVSRYARDRDPLTRVDVINMLVQSEDLIALTSRLIDSATAEVTGESSAIVARNSAALNAFLEAITVLVDLSEELLEATLTHDDEDALDEFIRHLGQVRLIYRFGTRFDRQAAHRALLSSLAQRVYDLCARLTRDLMSQSTRPARGYRRLSALHDLADELDWADLAAHLREYLRRAAIAVKAA